MFLIVCFVSVLKWFIVQRMLYVSEKYKEEEEELDVYDLSELYRLFKSLYSHMYRVYRGKKRRDRIWNRETWNSPTGTLVILRARSTAPIHRTDILRPHPTDETRKMVSLLKDTQHPAQWLVLEPGTPSS